MGNRLHNFAIDEYYHCYNRGTEKRGIFLDSEDFSYFEDSLFLYNTLERHGKLRLQSMPKPEENIVEVLSYSLLPNHFHLLLREKIEDGIPLLMKRVGTGYSMYFNKKYKRSGSLFQGAFKSKYIASDQDLRQVFAYVSENNRIHKISDRNFYRTYKNSDLALVRGFTSNIQTKVNMSEVVDIIVEQRLSFEH
jgi:putative transposase